MSRQRSALRATAPAKTLAAAARVAIAASGGGGASGNRRTSYADDDFGSDDAASENEGRDDRADSGRRHPARKSVSIQAPERIAGEGSFRRATLQHARTSVFSLDSSPCPASGTAAVVRGLMRHPLFAGISREFVDALVDASPEREVEAGEELDMCEDSLVADSLIVVKEGTLHVQVGQGEVVKFQPGSLINLVGFVGARETSRSFRPRRVSVKANSSIGPAAGAYEPVVPTERPLFRSQSSTVTQSVVPMWQDGGESDEASSFADDDDEEAHRDVESPRTPEGQSSQEQIFYAACPYAALHTPLWTKGQYLSLRISGPPDGDGVVIAMIPPLTSLLKLFRSQAMEKTWQLSPSILGDSMDALEAHTAELKAKWETLMRALGGSCFPAGPPEAIMALATVAETIEVRAGGVVVFEGSTDNAGDDLIVLASGLCSVSRRIPRGRGLPPVQQVIGRLRPDTVVGDLCLMGLGVPRPASVLAKTDVKVIRVGVPRLLRVLEQYPGCFQNLAGRLREMGEYFKQHLPTRTEVMRALHLFNDCDLAFLTALAQHGERKMMYFRAAVVEKGAKNDTMFVLEVGRCAIEIEDRECVGYVPVGNCFGERTLFGMDECANATVRVVTPLAILLAIGRAAVKAVVDAEPAWGEVVEQLRKAPTEGRVNGNILKNMELFRLCSSDFVGNLARVAHIRGYMPGHTVIVQGEQEVDPRMFVLLGGRCGVETHAERLVKLPRGAAFGELVMLGEVDRNSITVRATTFCFILEIRRSDFMAVLERHEDEREVIFSRFKERVDWPCFRDVDTRLLHLLHLHAVYKQVPPGFDCLTGDNAVLCLSGKAIVVDDHGNESREALLPGRCWNELIFVDAPPLANERLIARTACRLQLVSREQLHLALAEFPEEKEKLERAVVRYAAEMAEVLLGYRPAGTESIRGLSALFKHASDHFLHELRAKAEPRFYLPGATICGDGKEAECSDMFVIVGGTAHVQEPFEKYTVHAGRGFQEASLLGIARRYPGVFVADTLCLVLVIRRIAFDTVLVNFPEEAAKVARLREECGLVDFELLRSMLLRSTPFQKMPKKILEDLCPRIYVRIFAPGELMFETGEKCEIGHSPFFILLAGKVVVEGAEGTVLGTISRGSILGEIAAWGLASHRTATCRAARGADLVACARISGMAVKAVVNSHPTALDMMKTYHWIQQQANKLAEEKRSLWLKQTVVPSLSRTWLFSGCPRDFLHAIAVNVEDGITFQPGYVIRRVGEACIGMLLMLSGSAELLSTAGTVVGQVPEGGVFGEVCALGLIATCMATVRANTTCCVCEITKDALKEALKTMQDGDQIGQKMRRIVQARSEQAQQGMPLCTLHAGVKQQDISAKMVALLSHRITLHQGKIWQPVKQDCATGAYMLIVAMGQAAVVLGETETWVMCLPHGSVLSEPELLEFGARLKAVSVCDVYRIRRAEFNLAVEQDPAAKRWIWGFRLSEKEFSERMLAKLRNTLGLLQCKEEHELDKSINERVQKRIQQMQRADEIKSELCEPMQPSSTLSSTVTLPSLPGSMVLAATGGALPPSPSRRRLATSRSELWMRSKTEDCLLPALDKRPEESLVSGRRHGGGSLTRAKTLTMKRTGSTSPTSGEERSDESSSVGRRRGGAGGASLSQTFGSTATLSPSFNSTVKLCCGRGTPTSMGTSQSAPHLRLPKVSVVEAQ